MAADNKNSLEKPFNVYIDELTERETLKDDDSIITKENGTYTSTTKTPLSKLFDHFKSKMQNFLDDKIGIDQRGVANGVAELDENGTLPKNQLNLNIIDVTYARKDELPTLESLGIPNVNNVPDENKSVRSAKQDANGEIIDVTYARKDEIVTYEHPETHPATIISEDENHLFTNRQEKDRWNDKQDAGDYVTNEELKSKEPIYSSTAYTHQLQNTVESAAILDELKGKTVQEDTTGAQLFDASKVPTRTVNGITFNNNGDGSFTVSGTTTAVVSTSSYKLSDLEEGIYTIKINSKNVVFEVAISKDSGISYYNNKSFTIDGTERSVTAYLAIHAKTVNETVHPMLNYGETGLPFEKYTGGKPSPNPDYPQLIKGIGSRGWFDGELLQGYYAKGDGVYKISKDSVCSKNMIKVSSGDKVNIKYEIPIREIRMIIYDINGNFLGVHEIGDAKELVHTFQSNEAFFNFHMASVGQINPQTAKHISVLKNGKYCAWIRSVGSNIGEYYTFGGGTYDPTTYTLKQSGTPTDNVVNKITFQRYKRSIYVDEIYGSAKVGKHSHTIIKDDKFDIIIVKFSANIKDTYVSFNIPCVKDGESITISCENDSFTTNACKISNIMLNIGETVLPFEQYKESNIQIELDEPLWNEGKICKVDGKYGVYQKYKEIVLDGSADEAYTVTNNNLNTRKVFFSKHVIDFVRKVKDDNNSNNVKGLCNIFKFENSYIDIKTKDMPCFGFGIFTINGINETAICGSIESTIDTSDKLKAWLQDNKMVIVMELETPQFISFPDSAQAQFYSLRTYDQQTSVFLVDELQTEFTIDYASNSTGDYVLDAYATARVNEFKQILSEISLAEQLVSMQAMLDQQTIAIANKETKGNITQQAIPVNADLNNYKSAGFYVCGDNVLAGTVLNNPFVNFSFCLLVFSTVRQGSTNYSVQVALSYNNKIMYRNNAENVWSTWDQLYDTRNKPT